MLIIGIQMQKGIFVDNLAKSATLSGFNETVAAKFTLISNEYAGRDKQTGEIRERTVSIPFVAFRSKAEAIIQPLLNPMIFL